MSSVKATHIDGDVSVGRNVAIGGNTTVQGSSVFKKDLRVEGWFEADNIIGAHKGAFVNVENLINAYPHPHDGWWAIVGTTTPRLIYVGENGEWIEAGECALSEGNGIGDTHIHLNKTFLDNINQSVDTGADVTFGSVTTNSVVADREDDGVVVSSTEFDRSSVPAGFGYGILKDGFDYRLAIDYLTVRKGMTVAELVIQEYESVGGELVLSRANGEVDYVNWDSESDDGNPIYIVTTKDWERKPQFIAGDIVRCSRWDSTTHELVNYIGSVWMKTDDILYIEILDGNGIPQVGDNLVQFGHVSDKDRQGLIILSTEQGIPNISVFDGINDGNITQDKPTARLGDLTGLTNANGNALSGYGLWTNSLYLGSKAVETFNGMVDAVVGSRFEVTNDSISAQITETRNYIDGEVTSLTSSIDMQSDRITSEVNKLEGKDNEISTRIDQTAGEISLSVATLEGQITSAKAEIKATTDGITQSVNSLRTDVNGQISGLQSEITQTADNISLKVKEVVGTYSLNCAHGTDEPRRINEFSNSANQTFYLYDVSGLSAGEKFSLSYIARFKNVALNSADNNVAFINIQLDNNFGYISAKQRINPETLAGIKPDSDGYISVRMISDGVNARTIPDKGYTLVNGVKVEHAVTPSVVGKIGLRLDYVSATDDDAVLIIEELMIERGEECTAWTARTLNTEKALLATGIDIEKGLIKATADNFKVYNNSGVVTMEVDGAGNLTANAVLVRNMDPETKDATPYLARINLNTGFFEQFYPLKDNNGNDNISFQMGWDEMSQSLFRFYKKDGSMAWKAGAEAYLIDTTKSTETVISPVDLYKCSSATKDDATNEIKKMSSLATTRLYKKTVQSNGSVSVTYYSDASCSITASGFYTDGGLPEMAFSELGESSTVCRRLYTITDGSMGLAQFVSWDIHDGFDNNIKV